MKKHLKIVGVVLILGVSSWFIHERWQLLQAELELREELEKPKAWIGFTNKEDKAFSVKITSENGDFIWVALTRGSGSLSQYDAGKIIIESMRNDAVLASTTISLSGGERADFDIYYNKIVRRQSL